MNRAFAACALSFAFAGTALAQHVEVLNGSQPVRFEPNDSARVMADLKGTDGKDKETIGDCILGANRSQWCPIMSGALRGGWVRAEGIGNLFENNLQIEIKAKIDANYEKKVRDGKEAAELNNCQQTFQRCIELTPLQGTACTNALNLCKAQDTIHGQTTSASSTHPK